MTPPPPQIGAGGGPPPDVIERLVAGLVIAGAALRLWQYLAGASLFLGELALARNLTDRSAWQLLTEPLAYAQVIAPGYMLIQKLVLGLVGTGDHAMRLVPLLASLAALLLFVRMARRVIGGWALIVAVAGFSLGVPYLIYSGQIKPFGNIDVAAALGVFLAALSLDKGLLDRGTTWRAAITGFLLVWFSQSAPLVALGGSAGLLLDGALLRQRGRLRTLLPVLILWPVGALTAMAQAHFGMSADVREAFRNFYTSGYFPPLPHLKTELVWLWRIAIEAFGRLLFLYAVPVVFLVAAGLGAWLIFRRSRLIGLVFCLPVAAALLASMFREYEFRGYWLLSFFPVFFIAIGAAVDAVRARLAALARPIATMWILAWLAVPAIALAQYPPVYRIQEMKPVLSYVREHRRPGDALYVFFGARQAMAYYGLRFGFQPAEYTVGQCHHGAVREYFSELDQFRNQPRVWVVVTHDIDRYRERAELLHYLDQIGTVRDSIAVTRGPLPPFAVGAFAYLYDLSDSTRLGRATAASMTLLSSRGADPHLTCGWGPIATE